MQEVRPTVVSETENPLHIRMNGHWSDIQTKKLEKPVASHFNQPDHSLEDLAIEKIQRDDTTCRRHRESYWIFELATLAPSGINIDD